MPRRNRNGRGSPGNRGHRPSRKEMRKEKRNALRSQEEKLRKTNEEDGNPPDEMILPPSSPWSKSQSRPPSGRQRAPQRGGQPSGTKYQSSLAGSRDPESMREYFRSLNPSRRQAFRDNPPETPPQRPAFRPPNPGPERPAKGAKFEGRPRHSPPTQAPARPKFDRPRSHMVPNRPSSRTEGETRFVDGRIDIHPDGFGFLIPFNAQSPNIYVGEESLRYVMHRDEVRVQITHQFQRGEKIRGNVVEILKRHQKELIGVYRPFSGGALVVPVENRDRKFSFKVSGQSEGLSDLKSGSTVLCRITEYPEKGAGTVYIEKTFTDPTSPSLDTLKVLVESAWPREHSRQAVQEAEARAAAWKGELRGEKRVDLRKLPLVTIDGKDARDFDDAVYARFEGKSVRLWVAIADVSHFVLPGSQLDKEAFERSTSVYFPDFVVPMLPEVLSNGVCSLNPNEDRACLFVEMSITPQGKIVDWEFHEGLMRSHHRLTYELMQGYMEKKDFALEELEHVGESLDALIEAFERLNKARMRRGSIDLDIAEAQVILKPNGEVLDMQPRTRLGAHRLIEECMLAANECAAKFLREYRDEGVYRIHEAPDPQKVDVLLDFLSKSGLDMGFAGRSKGKKKGKGPSAFTLEEPGDFAQLLETLKTELSPDDPVLKAVQSLVLRSMKQAKYAPIPVGHFALAAPDYTHFTSPIRRYPDLIVHRLIRDFLRNPGSPKIIQHGWANDLENAAQHCSERERSAMEAERKLIEIKKCRYLEKHLGEEFDAWVTGVVEKGVFCQIDGHFVDGLVSAEVLHRRARLRFDAESLAYVGPGKTKVTLGTRVKVMVAAVSVETRRVDFDLMEIVKASNA